MTLIQVHVPCICHAHTMHAPCIHRAHMPTQWLDTGGYNTRDCELSADESMLFAVDVVASRLPHPSIDQTWNICPACPCRVDPCTGMFPLPHVTAP